MVNFVVTIWEKVDGMEECGEEEEEDGVAMDLSDN